MSLDSTRDLQSIILVENTDELSKKGLQGNVGEVQMDIVMEDKSTGIEEFTFLG